MRLLSWVVAYYALRRAGILRHNTFRTTLRTRG